MSTERLWTDYEIQRDFTDWSDLCDRHNAEIAALEAERDQLTILLNSGTCIYCLETFSKDSDLAAHIHSCPSHPLGKALARAKAAEAERDELRRRIDAVLAMMDPGKRPEPEEYEGYDQLFRERLCRWKDTVKRYERAKDIAEVRDHE